MAVGYIFVLFVCNFFVAAFLYLYLYKVRKLIGFQLGMNIAIIIGGMMAIVSGILLIIQFPFHYTEVTIASTLLGMIIGGIYGAMFDYQTFLTGFTNGLMMGIMSPMIGAVIDNRDTFVLLMEGLYLASIFLVIISRKGS
ncbi:hypothetical protein [Bacillus sp. JJ1562]|uniref:hypothetical protein n=1 Tax=Bacillus sp. JJ1562 TaxID=3122960 RepID=UPI003001036B